ncbi:squalene--hopene cyclase [Actinoplanes sp. NPDC051494]|uniref:squalene--hopene cyclase n=1 Tax=Actinoplanes sp. NPDC051494 TaxID=3363907 RepID=UPI0037B142D6
MVDIDAAIGYVVAHGDPIERARLSFLRAGTPPPPSVLDTIGREQTGAGGWPAGGDTSVPSVDATCIRLAELDDLGCLHGPQADRAVTWLAGVQRSDGSWQEDDVLAPEAPPWAKPGDPEATLYLTAVAGFWTTAAGRHAATAAGQHAAATAAGQHAAATAAGQHAVATAAGQHAAATAGGRHSASERAARFVAARLRPDGTWPSFLAAGWYAAGLLHGAQLFYESARVQLVLGDRLDGMSPADVATMAAVLRRAGLGDDELLAGAHKRLTGTQRTDGGWDSDEGPVFDVNTTLTVIRACR